MYLMPLSLQEQWFEILLQCFVKHLHKMERAVGDQEQFLLV
jgi:hypothetical protein